jgi:DNA-binding GntR family transcriptional regulator
MDEVISPDRPETARPAAPRLRTSRDAAPLSATLVEQAYALLRRDILSGALEPGLKLRIGYLRDRYGIGPSPLREALSRLVSERLVAVEERRGFHIPPISLADLRDIADQRKLLECTALRTAIETADAGWESEVLAAHHRLRKVEERLAPGDEALLDEWEKRHREYHEALIAGARSRWLRRFQRILYDQADRYRRLYLAEFFVPPAVHEEHNRILAATLDRDADTACRELADHIERIYATACKASCFRALDAGARKG